MGKGIPGLDQAYHILFTVTLVVLAIMIILCLIRAIIGPRIADRIVATNMMGTIVMVIIAILAIMLGEVVFIKLNKILLYLTYFGGVFVFDPA